MRRSTFRTRVVTICNKSRPCHKVLGNHLYIVSHNWTGEYHQTGQEQSLSVIIQDKITQVPWHTHKPAHITHTHTHSVSHVLWHTSTQTNTLTHTNTHTQTRDWFSTYTHKHTHTNTRLKLFSRSRHKHTHTPSQKQPFLKIWTGQHEYITSHTYTICEWISVMVWR